MHVIDELELYSKDAFLTIDLPVSVQVTLRSSTYTYPDRLSIGPWVNRDYGFVTLSDWSQYQS